MNNHKASLLIVSILCAITLGSFLFVTNTRIQAKQSVNEPSKSTLKKQTSTDLQEKSTEIDLQPRILDPIENESGLKATPKVLILKQDDAFPNLDDANSRKLLFSKVVIPVPAPGAEYEYVTSEGLPVEPSSAEAGFQTLYVEITENNSHTSIRVPIPVTVKDLDTTMLLKNKVAVQANNVEGKILFYPEETKDKTPEQLEQLIKERAGVRAWDTENGREVPLTFLDTNLVGPSVGAYKANFEVTLEQEKATAAKKVVVFGANPKAFVSIAQNEALALSANPTNLFSKFQTVTTTSAANVLFQFVDDKGVGLPSFDTSEVGFHWANVKMTEKTNAAISTIIKVPINVTSADTTAALSNKVMVHADANIVLYPDETKEKSAEELIELTQSKAHLRAWNMSTGEVVPVDFIKTTVKNNTVGAYTGTIEVKLEEKIQNVNRKVTVFGADLNAKIPYHTVTRSEKLEALSSNLSVFFSKYQTMVSALAQDATFEWVADKTGKPTEPVNNFDTSEVGFHWGYMKMTDKSNPEIATIIPIAITVTAENQTIIDSKAKVGFSYDLTVIKKSEIAGKTSQELLGWFKERLALKAYILDTGEQLNPIITKLSTESPRSGQLTLTVNVYDGEKELTTDIAILIVPNTVFGDDQIDDDWDYVSPNGSNGVIVNPLNGSKMGFPARGGMSKDSYDNDLGFRITDKNDEGYVFPIGKGRVAVSPGVNYKSLDPRGFLIGIGLSDVLNNTLTMRYFLRKENMLRAILMDTENEVMYVYNLLLNRNLNFSVRIDMYNLSIEDKSFAMSEMVDTDYLSDNVAMYALGNNSGFYMQPKKGKRFTIKLKDSIGNWLSDYTKYYAGALNETKGKDPHFGIDFSGSGTESKNYEAGKKLPTDGDSAYELGAPWKKIAPDKALKTGYEIFAGDELPYMQLNAEPEVFNIYPDYTGEFKSRYKLSEIPKENNHGTIYVTYPNKKEDKVPFTANSEKEFAGQVTIPRSTLPSHLNEEMGTIKTYTTSLLAIDDTEGPTKGLPSEESAVDINVYKLGAKPIAQVVKKSASFTKKAEEIVQDQVILPNHTASFEYEGEMPDTSTVGLKFVYVRMTDTQQPEQTALIKVPVQVVDGTVPAGITISANDFTSTAEEFMDMSEIDLKKRILEKSEAMAWDSQTGSIKDIVLSVDTTTLVSNPTSGEYKATIKAAKGSVSQTQDITITIGTSEQQLNVVFKDEEGLSLHDPVTLTGTVGTTIDLTKEAGVKKALDEIKENNYILDKAPENETAILIEKEEKIVSYQFKGTLFIESFPKLLNFGRKSLGSLFIKVDKAIYDTPLTILDNRKNSSAWQLTAKLEKVLTSQEDSSKELPRALRYKLNEEETVVLSKDIIQPITEKKGDYNVSNEWDSDQSGLQLEVPSGEVLQPGGYRATILWQVAATP